MEKSISGTSVSRRSFFRLAAAASTLAALPLTEPEMAHAAIQQAVIPGWNTGYPAGAVRIDSNENPLGPCQSACESMAHRLHQDGRYDFYLSDKVAETFATLEGLKPENISVYAGSTVPLHHAVLAFTSKDRSYVTADPSYETGMKLAALNGVKVVKVPLAADYSHDTRAMVSADPHAGLFYICNPNNPTGTLTSREQIEYAVAHKPAGSVLLIDEAYIHFSERCAPSIDLVKAGKDVIVLRTFSKIYGMAGLRCGMAIARPDLLQRLALYGRNFNPMPATSCAIVSLQDKTLVPSRRKINTDIREATFDWLHKNHFKFIPSESNCFLLSAGRPGHEVMAAMARQNVFIGRVWPVMPDWVRITVGSHQDMARFQTAWKKVMESSTAAFTLPTGLRFHSELPPLNS